MSDFPHIKAMGLGLRLLFSGRKDSEYCVSADELEKALSEAPQMKIQYFGKTLREIPSGWTGCENPSGDKMTHTARLVCIQEIPKESVKREITREDLARAWDADQSHEDSQFCSHFKKFCKELGL